MLQTDDQRGKTVYPQMMPFGHCGVTRNEHVDLLAKQALSIPLDAQVRVPIDYADAKQRVKTSPVADKLIRNK